MPKNKSAIIRYKVIDRCLRNRFRKHYWQNLASACESALYEEGYQDPSVSRSTIYNDLKFMESEIGYKAPIEHVKDGKKTYYRYEDPTYTAFPDTLSEEDIRHLEASMNVLGKLDGHPGAEWIQELRLKIKSSEKEHEPILSFENNPYLKGLDHLNPLFHHILNKEALWVTYQEYGFNESKEFPFHPYYLKQYNKRWYVFGHNPDSEQEIWNLALDRIQSFSNTQEVFVENIFVDFEDFFSDIIGVTKLDNVPVEEVIIAVEEKSIPYIETKPIHETQRPFQQKGDRWFTRIFVRPNYELYATLLSFGTNIEVLGPSYVRDKVSSIAQEMATKYQA